MMNDLNELLESITTAKAEVKAVREAAKARIAREELEAKARLDVAIRLAYNAGATKSQLGEALGTKDRRTVLDALARTETVNSAAVGKVTNLGNGLYEFSTYVNEEALPVRNGVPLNGRFQFDLDGRTGALSVPESVSMDDFPLYTQIAAGINTGKIA